MRPEWEPSSHTIAIEQYNEAIQQLNRVITGGHPDSTEAILVCCFFFVCIECLFGRPAAATGHAQAGLRVHREWLQQGGPFRSRSPSSGTGPGDVDYCIWRLCSELENQIWLLTGGQWPTTPPARWEDAPYSLYYASRDFSTPEQAQISLDTISKRLYFLVHESQQRNIDLGHSLPQEMLKEHRVIGRLLEEFDAAFRRMVSGLQHGDIDRSILLLEMQHVTLIIMHKNLLGPNNTDEWTSEYGEVVKIGEEILKSIPSLPSSPNASTTSFEPRLDVNIDPTLSMAKSERTGEGLRSATGSPIPAGYTKRIPSFTLASGMVPCLYFVTRTCTSVSLRRRAIAMLYAANCVEGIWSAQSAARAAEEILAAELRGAAPTQELGLMPLRQMLGVVEWTGDATAASVEAIESFAIQL